MFQNIQFITGGHVSLVSSRGSTVDLKNRKSPLLVGRRRLLIAVAALISVFASVQAQAEVIEDTNIRTWTYPFSGWNMEDQQYRNLSALLPSDLLVDKILGAKVLIYSDDATPEVFNLSRLANIKSQNPSQNPDGQIFRATRAGGWAEILVWSDRYINIWLDRGPCSRSGSSVCSDSTVESFFAAKSASNGGLRLSQTFKFAAQRTFYNEAKPRGVVKIDYACSNCGSQSTQVFWKKIGPWDMRGGSRSFTEGSLGVNPATIVDMSAAIYSDPMPDGKIFVDELEHMGTRPTGLAEDKPYRRDRGGALWFGYGCRTSAPGGCRSDAASYSQMVYRLSAGIGHRNSYRGGLFEPEGTSPADVHYDNNAVTPNRGWLRVEYTGNKSAVNVPYAFKSKAVSLGEWPMMDKAGHSIGFSQLGVAANRISRISATIRSDQASADGFTSYRFSNLFRPNFSSGVESISQEAQGGGPSYIDEGRGIIAVKHGTTNQAWQPSHYYNSDYDGTANRGYVLLDYLAGSCEQGPAGYMIRAVPGTTVGNCTGNSQPFTIEGAGRGTPTAAHNTTDSLTYVYKTSTAANLTVSVRVESFDASTAHVSALAGVMFRATLNSNSKNASMMALHGSNAVSFRRRINDGNPTIATAGTAPQYARWLRVQKTGGTFRAFMHSANTQTMPTTGWTQIGQENISFPGTFYYGLQVSNFDSPKLTKATMRNLTVQ